MMLVVSQVAESAGAIVEIVGKRYSNHSYSSGAGYAIGSGIAIKPLICLVNI